MMILEPSAIVIRELMTHRLRPAAGIFPSLLTSRKWNTYASLDSGTLVIGRDDP
jgi:hypothetical protein